MDPRSRPCDYGSLPVSRLKTDDLVASRAEPFLFGAMALLADNAVARNAENFGVFTERDAPKTSRGELLLSFSDDGRGFSPTDACKVLCRVQPKFSDARIDPEINKYGNLLCMSAMRIGADALLFTKGTETACVCLLSQSLQEHVGSVVKGGSVVTPFAAWAILKDGRYAPMGDSVAHSASIDAIVTHSPFGTVDTLLERFNTITSSQGNVVVCYNLWEINRDGASPWAVRNPEAPGELELDCTSIPNDVQLRCAPARRTSPRRSLKHYLSLLYLAPSLRIAVQGEWLRSCHPCSRLVGLQRYPVTTDKFTAAKAHLATISRRQTQLSTLLRNAFATLSAIEKRHAFSTPETLAAATRDSRNSVEQYRRDLSAVETELSAAKMRSLDVTLHFVCGVNIEERSDSGLLIYHGGRLIRLYERCLQQEAAASPTCVDAAGGVVAYVNLPTECLPPALHRQGFASAEGYQQLTQCLDQHVRHFWGDFCDEHGIGSVAQVAAFWEVRGYRGNGWCSAPSEARSSVSARRRGQLDWFRCERCSRWRAVPDARALHGGSWVCGKAPGPEGSCTSILHGQPVPCPVVADVPLGRPLPTVGEAAAALAVEPAPSGGRRTEVPPRDGPDKLRSKHAPATSSMAVGSGSSGAKPDRVPNTSEKDEARPHLPRYSHDSPERPKKGAPSPSPSLAPPPLKKQEDALTLAPATAASVAGDERLVGLLRQRVRDCLDRVTPPDLLADVGAAADPLAAAMALPRLAADFKAFETSCDTETTEQLRESKRKEGAAAEKLDACCRGARRLLQDLNGGAVVAGVARDPAALAEVLKVLLETTSRSLPRGWMLGTSGGV